MESGNTLKDEIGNEKIQGNLKISEENLLKVVQSHKTYTITHTVG